MALDDAQEAALRQQLAAESAKRAAAEQAAEDRRKTLEADRAAHATALAAANTATATATAAVAAERQTWTTERVLLERGLTDPVDRKVALLLYGELPEAGRPELGAYLDGVKADPTKTPRQLAHVWAPPSSSAPPAPGAPPAPPRPGAPPPVPPPAPPKPGEVNPGAGSQLTVEQIRQAGERARRPGATDADRQAFTAIQDQLDQEVGRRRA